MINVRHVAANLVQRESGMWRSAWSQPVSYPEGGHAASLQAEDRSLWFRNRNACVRAAMAPHRPQGPLFDVDVGGCYGFFARALLAAGLPTILVEPGPQGAADALHRGVEHVVCATLGSAGFRARALPAVGTFDVIEHTKDNAGFVGKLVRMLQPGGWLIATVPAHGWVRSDANQTAGHWRRYGRRYGRRSFEGRLRLAGLELAYAMTFFRCLPVSIPLGCVLPFRIGLRRPCVEPDIETRQYGVNVGLRVRLASRLLASEVPVIAQGQSMAFGTSILAVARKPGAVMGGGEVRR